MSPSATLATQNESSCEQVPRLPRKVPRRDGRLTAPKRATRASPVPQVPRLPRQTRVDVAKCYACHAKRRWMSPSATPATQSAKVPRHHGRPTAPKRATRESPVPQVPRLPRKTEGRCRQVPRLPQSAAASLSDCQRKNRGWIMIYSHRIYPWFTNAR